MDWEFKNFLSVWFSKKIWPGVCPIFVFKCLVWKCFKNLNQYLHGAKSLNHFCVKIDYWLSFLFSLGTPGAVGFCLGTPGAVGFFENFSKSFKSRKIWPGVCPFLKFWVLVCDFENLEIRKYSKCRFLGKIGQGSALHWCFLDFWNFLSVVF